MHTLENLNDLLEEQVEKIVKKGDISPTELDNAYKAVKTMNYIETIKAMQEYGESNGNSNGYSYRGSYGRGSYGGNSSRGNYGNYNDSMSNDGRRGRDGDSDGHYSEEGSYRRGRDAMGRYTSRDGYSRAEEKNQMISKLERMMDNANSESERQTIMQCIRKIESDN